MKLILFDIDGTLLWTDTATKAANRAFSQMFGIKNALSGISLSGKTDPLILEEMFDKNLGRKFDDGEAEEIYKIYIEFLNHELASCDDSYVLPGVRELIYALNSSDNIILGVATGNIEQGAWLKLKHMDLDDYFKFGGFGSDSAIREELIKKAIERAINYSGYKVFEKVFVVGDTPYDITHGRAAGALTVGVATGSYSEDELKQHNPDFLFSDFSEFSKVVSIFC